MTTEDYNEDEDQDSEIIIGMMLFNDGETYSLNKVVDHLKTNWNVNVTSVSGNEEAAVITAGGESFTFMYIPEAVPFEDLEEAAESAYYWPNAADTIANHDAHLIVSVMTNDTGDLNQHKIYTKVISSVFETTNAIAVFQDDRNLMVPKEMFVNAAAVLKEHKIPVSLWVYIGTEQTDDGNCAYTLGLSAFDKAEFEVINSDKSIQDLYSILANISLYVISKDVYFEDGYTFGYSEDQKTSLFATDGEYIDGEVFLLDL
jgi:hypothetical protein